MWILLLLWFTNFKVVVPCKGVFRADSPACCGRKKVGGVDYLFKEYINTQEFGCNQNCSYTVLDGNPHKQFCFKTGDMESVCQDNTVRIQWTRLTDPNAESLCVIPGTTVIFEGVEGECPQLSKSVCRLTEKQQQDASSHCAYTPSEPGTCIFFKDKSKAEIKSDHCNCRSGEEVDAMVKTSMNSIHYNMKLLSKFANDTKHKPPLKFDEFVRKAFRLKLQIIPPDLLQLYQYSSTCSPVSFQCERCYRSKVEASAQCIIFKQKNLCNNYIEASISTCKSCLDEMTKTCNGRKHQEQIDLRDENVSDSCDRDCTSSPPKKCIFNLKLEEQTLEDFSKSVVAYNRIIPGPMIVICEGDELVVNLHNNLKSNTTLHFHGIREIYRPWADGVPWVSQYPIPKGGNFTYGFKATDYYSEKPGTYTQSGTYWYHSHFQAQRTNGAYGALIIRPNKTEHTRYDVEISSNTMIVQEWYEDDNTSILINGKTSGFVFNITDPGNRYMFRIIGAISEDVPLRISIEDHTFTAIAADSQDIQPVSNLGALWVAAGERFHIVIETKTQQEYKSRGPYKIQVYGHAWPNTPLRSGPLCAIAWLKYPNQDIPSPVAPDCSSLKNLQPNIRALNPPPIHYNEWQYRLKKDQFNTTNPGNFFIGDLRGKHQKETDLYGKTIHKTVKSVNYMELKDNFFDMKKMRYPKMPFLLQNPSDLQHRCGSFCNLTVKPALTIEAAETVPYMTCKEEQYDEYECNTDEICHCEHVIAMPFAPQYWTEFVLINNNLNETSAHPIHQHGGWYWVVGMEKFDHNINKTWIMEKDCAGCESPEYKSRGLHRNFHHPPAKDTIQVPPGGYVILRTPLDNKGTWLVHCHINQHVLDGMAFVLQIGGPGYTKRERQEWCNHPSTHDQYV